MREGQHNRSASAAGFTLIELLVILAVIAILAAMLAPVYAEARGKVRAFTCLSNLRQIGTAASMYTQDWDEMFASVPWLQNAWLPDVHEPYVKNWKNWLCPGDTEGKLWDGLWYSPSWRVRMSYIGNAYVFNGDADDWRRAISLPAVSHPSSLVIWGEGYAHSGWIRDAAPLSAPSPENAYVHNAYGDSAHARPRDPSAARCSVSRAGARLDVIHAGGGNYAFADGHAKWHKPSAFTTDSIEEFGFQSDPSDPLLTNGARSYYVASVCGVFCCPQSYGTPPGDGNHPWFRP